MKIMIVPCPWFLNAMLLQCHSSERSWQADFETFLYERNSGPWVWRVKPSTNTKAALCDVLKVLDPRVLAGFGHIGQTLGWTAGALKCLLLLMIRGENAVQIQLYQVQVRFGQKYAAWSILSSVKPSWVCTELRCRDSDGKQVCTAQQMQKTAICERTNELNWATEAVNERLYWN